MAYSICNPLYKGHSKTEELDVTTDVEDEYDDDEPLLDKFTRLLAESNRMFGPKRPSKVLQAQFSRRYCH